MVTDYDYDDDERQARAIAFNRLYEAAPEKGGIGGSLIMQAGFFAGWTAGRAYEREHGPAQRDLAWIKESVLNNQDVCDDCRKEIARANGWENAD